jgi:ATP-dependent helicase/nuclease subunit A
MNPPALIRLGARPTDPPAFTRLSEEQSAALALDAELSVVAGAGAGKTSTLAARYVRLLHALLVSRGAAPEPTDVLVLTFTERAAAEMRERCLRMVNEMAAACSAAAERAGEAGSPTAGAFAQQARAWRAVRDRFPAASIHTFHGFCARLLREFPAETGTPPGGTMLDDAASEVRLAEAASDAVRTALAAGGESILLLLESFAGAGQLHAAVCGLLARRGELRGALARLAQATATSSSLLAEAGLTDAGLVARLEAWRAAVRPLLAVTSHVDTGILPDVRAVEAGLDAALCDPEPLVRCEAWQTALDTLAKRDGGLRNLTHHTSIGTKGSLGPAYAAAQAAAADLQAAAEGWAGDFEARSGFPTRHDLTHAAVRAALARLVIAARDRLEASFDVRNELDFAELVARARRGVVGGGLAALLQERHRYVMVDEFQDTDVDQWELVEAITRGADTSDRLFVVGDPKQSIYGFRGGDVAVFERARQTIARRLLFADNHRSRPAIVTFANHAFQTILGGGGAPRAAWQVGYDPMRAASPTTGGTVILATGTRHEPRNAAADAWLEARWVARTVRERILAGVGPWAGTAYGDTARHPAPPIAVLLRRRTRLPLFEAALRAEGVSVVVDGGAGFWSRPEVLDCGHALRALATGDRLSVAGALRSPLFGVSDRALLLLGRSAALADFGRAPLPEALLGEPELVAAHARWGRLRARLLRGSPATALEALLSEAAAPWLLSLDSPDGQAEANVARLLERADMADEAGLSPAAFAQAILDAAASEVREGEASLPDTGARVCILTVHGSKGLEYPVVIVPELGTAIDRRPGSNVVLSRAPNGEWDINCAVVDRFGPVRSVATPGALVRARAILAEMGVAEQRRVFYVACTRAVDSLVLVGLRPPKSTPGTERSWLDLLDAANVGGVVVQEGVVAPGEPAPPTATAVEEVEEGDVLASITPHVAPPRWVLAPSALQAAIEQRGASAAVPRAAPSQVVPDDDPEAEDEVRRRARAREIAAVRGTVLHGLLEDDCIDTDDLAWPRWQAEAAAAGLTAEEVAAGWESVRRQLEVMRASPDVAAVLDARGHAELPLRMDLAGLRVEGRLDRLCRDRLDGAWMVVDYKTESPGADPLATALHHRVQLLAYSLAASRVLVSLGREPVKRAAVLFTRTGALVRLPDWTEADAASLEARAAELVAAWTEGPA